MNRSFEKNGNGTYLGGSWWEVPCEIYFRMFCITVTGEVLEVGTERMVAVVHFIRNGCGMAMLRLQMTPRGVTITSRRSKSK